MADVRGDQAPGDADPAGHAEVARLQHARPTVPEAEQDRALARLRASLFGGPSPGPQLERYPIERCLGRGGGGTVYLARDRELDRPVAIKVLGGVAMASDPASSRAAARLVSEAEALARAPHPNVLAIYDLGTFVERDGATAMFLVLEYVEGQDLRHWLEQRRPWRRVLEVFVAAGRGLAAAHRAGVVHRDVKPANLMLGADGRVRVVDFGLARGLLGGDGHDTVRERGGDGDEGITAAGTIVGTPGYMAPEQHLGRDADAASDQYGFCVSLWEALLGSRPFVGASLEALAAAKRAGPGAPPLGHAVPPMVIAALERGLCPEPAGRHADMDALLAALTAALRPRAPVAPWIAAAAIATLGVGWVAARTDIRGCDEPLPLRDPAAREALVATILGDAPRDDAALARLRLRLDGFVEPWTAARAAVCELGPEHGAAFDLPYACLDAQRREAEAAWAVLAAQPELGITRALAVLERLPDPSACDDVERLGAAEGPPPPPAQAAAVAQLRDRLAQVWALDAAGEHEQALSRAQALVPEAEALGHAPVVAEALLHLGSVQASVGDYALAASTLERGHAEAVASRHDRVAGRIAAELVFVEGERRGRLPQALAWAQHASAAIDRAGTDDPSRLPSVLGAAYVGAGRFAEARQAAEQALQALPPGRRADPARAGMLLNNLGEIERQLGDLDAAREHLGEALQLWQTAYGPDHPHMAMVLNNLGALDLVRDDTVAGEAKFRRVVEIRERALGRDHPMLATSLANLAVCQRRNGDLAGARASFVRAHEILRSRGMGDDPKAVAMIAGIATVDAEAGDFVAALRGYDQAIFAYEASLGEHYPDLARVLANRAAARVRTGALQAGLADAARTDAIAAEVWGAGHARVAHNRLMLVHALDEVGEHERAQALVERALAELDDHTDPVATKLEAERQPLPAQVWP